MISPFATPRSLCAPLLVLALDGAAEAAPPPADTGAAELRAHRSEVFSALAALLAALAPALVASRPWGQLV